MSGACYHIPSVNCANCTPQYPNRTWVFPEIQQPRSLQGQKCDICGSTAIDHTEAQCSMNRQFKNLTSSTEAGL